MINVPVHKSDDYDDEFIKIINGHHDLIKALKDMVEIVGSNFCSNKDTKSAYRNARELLEQLR